MTSVVHTPLGQEHPYETLPEERSPRQPLAGEAFVVGIVTRPPGAAQRVTLHSTIDGVPQPTIEASRLDEWRPAWEEGVGAEFMERKVVIDQDVWQATLHAPAYGQTLEYWVESDAGTTGRYSLRGEQWVEAGHYAIDEAATIVRYGDTSKDGENAKRKPGKIEWLHDGRKARRVRLTFEAKPDEGFFGLGERFNALDQRGNIMDIRVYEQYKSQGKRTYMPIPFLLSSAGYGLWVESARWMQFDLAATSPDVWTLEADLGPDETLKLHWFEGDDPFEIVGQFSKRTGASGDYPAPLPPDWAFGLWMSANDWNSQARVEKEVRASFEHGIQPTVVVIEAWSDENTFYIWNDAEYTPRDGSHKPHLSDFTFPAQGRWPDPKAMTDRLHEQGIKLILWQIPVMKVPEVPHPQQDADRAYFEQKGFGVHNADGTRHKIRPFWFRGGYIWDVTNPAERDWWFSKREYLLTEIGIDGFKTDGGEHLWGTDTRFTDGRGGDEVWNEYPQRYTEAYYQFTNQHREGVTFSRAGYTGSQRSPMHWAGDENSTWDAFRHSVYAGLSAGISGIPFWGWDFGGFSGDVPTAELYLRGAAMAAFCPVMQYHAEYNGRKEPNRDRTPWNIQARSGDERVVPSFRTLLNVRYALMPYIWQEVQFSAATGQPMMRAARLYDSAASEFDYFFGRDLFVSPVVHEGAKTWDVRLPAGQWRDLWTGKAYSGEQTVTVEAPLDRIPVFVREGAVVPARLPDGAKLGDSVPFGIEATGMLVFD